MTKKPSGFVVYPEHVNVTRLLPDEERGLLLLALSDYAENQTLPEGRSAAFMTCFELMKNAIDSRAERYREACERNRQNVMKRWSASDSSTLYGGIRSNTSEYERIRDLPLDTNDTNRTEKNREESKDRTPRKRFSPPSLEEVRDYCESRGSPVDPERFVSYYESVGWRVGKQPMKSWKSAIVTWEKREAKTTTPKQERVSPYARYESN